MKSKNIERLLMSGALAAGLSACAGTNPLTKGGYGFCSYKTSDVLSMCIKDYPKMLVYYNRVYEEPTQCKMTYEENDMTTATLTCKVLPESCKLMVGYKDDSRSLYMVDNYCNGSVDKYIETNGDGIEVQVKRNEANEEEFKNDFDPLFSELSSNLWVMTIPICPENK